MPDTSDPSPPAGEVLIRPRPPRSWRERVEQLADATGTTPLRITVGAGLAAVALFGATVLLRPAAPPSEVSLPFASTTAASLSTTTTAPPQAVVVHVAGAVVTPGLHELPPGARVADAIAAAGGLVAEADEARINLAAPVADGERVYVPVVGEDAPSVVVGGSRPPEGTGGEPLAGLVNLNTADETALDVLPGVGPATAAAIITYREEIGGFTSVDELLDVPGIGEAKLEQLRPLVTV